VEKKRQPTLAAVQATYPNAEVELWAEDEHRLGLHPVNRMVWVPLGEQPTASVNWRYQWLWLIGFVQPTTGLTYWWMVPTFSCRSQTENWRVFEQVLQDNVFRCSLEILQPTM
jgi:hypothetical protein